MLRNMNPWAQKCSLHMLVRDNICEAVNTLLNLAIQGGEQDVA